MSNHIDNFNEAARQSSGGMISEFCGFLRSTGKWWMLPIIATLLVFGLLVVAGGSVAAPFIYTLF